MIIQRMNFREEVISQHGFIMTPLMQKTANFFVFYKTYIGIAIKT
jgi:hypothetical protein